MKKLLLYTILVSMFYSPGVSQDFENLGGYGSEDNIHNLIIDANKEGEMFEGFGSLSAGASSRLLYDYPEPYRSEILDYLFKPNFGANIHHLKVEIGGDINSTDGSEPSIAATREEFENPKPGYFKRGYEYWLMAEAKKRNPNIILEGLQWGAPGWIGNGKFYSKDNAEFVCAWIKGAKKYWNLDINYVGIWNERQYDVDYIKLLRKALDEQDLQDVVLVAGELWKLHEKWKIADDIVKDTALANAVGVINSHTTEELNYFTTENVKKTGKPVWAGESHFYGADWYAAASWARAYRSYMAGGITKVINWSLISSYHNFLVVPGSGLMIANTPWSGHYKLLPSIWVLAHINQFARPGWKYLDSGSKWWASEGSLNEGLSMITLKDTITNDYSIIIETMDAKEPQTLNITVSEDLSDNDLIVFRSIFEKEEFVQQEDIAVKDGAFSIKVFPNSIYSLTTLRGPKKGVAPHDIPEDKAFSLSYYNDFENQKLHTPAKYFSDQHGTFEVVELPGKVGRGLKQIVLDQGICWRCDWKHPETFVGDISWKDYKVSADFMLPEEGEVILAGRASGNPYTGYRWTIGKNGKWELKIGNGKVLASGQAKRLKERWHNVEMVVDGNLIIVSLDNKKLAEVRDDAVQNGVAALATGWNFAYFDNIEIAPIE